MHLLFIPKRCVVTVVSLLVAFATTSCVRVKVDPVKIDATFTIKMEKELDDFFNTLDASSKTLDVSKDESNKPVKDKP